MRSFIFVLFTKYYGNQIKDKMEGHAACMGEMRNVYTILV
jgi:hypothetical protein